MFAFSKVLTCEKYLNPRNISILYEQIRPLHSCIYLEKIDGRRINTNTQLAISSMELKVGDLFRVIVTNPSEDIAKEHNDLVIEMINNL